MDVRPPSALHHPRRSGHCIIPGVCPTCTGNRAKCWCCPIRTSRRTRSSQNLAACPAEGGVYYTSRKGISLLGLYITAFLLNTTFISGVSTEQLISTSQQARTLERLTEGDCSITSSELSATPYSYQEISMKDSYYLHRLRGDSSSDNDMGHSVLPIGQNTQKVINESTRLWVFGYGSLVWKTGFKFSSKKVGFIDGFVRRFWQGDTIHRGTEHKPGRVATLEENSSGNVWGVAFELTGREEIDIALEHLGMRECILGGYTIKMVTFYPSDNPEETIDTLVFVANPENNNYLGSATIEQLTHEIIDSRGNAGHNVEYVTRLADFLREHVPGFDDPHLLELDNHLRRSLLEKSIDLKNLLANTVTNYNYMYSQSKNEGQTKCKCMNSQRALEATDVAYIMASDEENNNQESQDHHHRDLFPLDLDLFEDIDK